MVGGGPISIVLQARVPFKSALVFFPSSGVRVALVLMPCFNPGMLSVAPWRGAVLGKPFCFWFPPFHLLAATISKIAAERANGILVFPDWPLDQWLPLLRQLPSLPHGRGGPFRLYTGAAGSMFPTPRVPHGCRGRGLPYLMYMLVRYVDE